MSDIKISNITWTELPDKTGAVMTAHEGSWGDLLERVKTAGTFSSKEECPWLKLASFGTKRSAQNSLRTNENVIAVFGVELDYDRGVVPLEKAASMLEAHGIKAALYPSASSTAENHRWRVIAPLAEQHPPSARAALVARLNGALGGIAAGESFTLSQSFLFGATPTNDYRVVVTFNDPTAGQCIDVLHDLDAGAMGKAGANPTPEGAPRKPIDDDIFRDAVACAGRLLATGDGRRDLLKSYTASKSARGLQRDDIKRMARGCAAEFFDPNDPVTWADIDHLIDATCDKDAVAGFDNLVDQAKAASAPRYKLLGRAELAALPPLAWCVRGVLPAVGLAGLYGPSASGKSFLAFDMAAAIASGERWFDCRVQAAPVVYAALEGEAGFKLRAQAWETHNGRTLPDGLQMVLQPFNLTTAQDVADMAAVVPAGAVVFIDTLNRAAPTADENSSKDMGEILEAAKRLQTQTGGLVVLVHHTGKDTAKGLRGHSSLFAALDAAVEVSREGDHRVWKIAKAKDGRDGQAHAFALEVVDLFYNEHGESESSCVVVGDGPTPTAKGPTPAQRLALADLLQIEDLGLGVHLDEWREVVYRRMGDAKEPTKRQALNRAADALVKIGALTRDGDMFMVSEPLF